MPPAGDLAFVTQSDSIADRDARLGRERSGSASRASSRWARAPTSSSATSSTTSPSTSRPAPILVHLEGIADARRFMSAGTRRGPDQAGPGAQGGAPDRPAVRAGAGGVGIRLHRDRVYDAAFARAGLVRVDSIEELFAAAASLGAGAARRGHGLRNGRLALLTNGHGSGRARGRRAARRRRRRSCARRRGSTSEIARRRGRDGLARELGRSRARTPTADAYAAALDVLLDIARYRWRPGDPRAGGRHRCRLPSPPRWRQPPTGASRAARSGRCSRPGWASASERGPRRVRGRGDPGLHARPRPRCAPSCIASSTSGASSSCARSPPRVRTTRSTGSRAPSGCMRSGAGRRPPRR